MKTWLTSLISLFLWQLPVSLSEEGRWQGVQGAGVVGSLVCEATYCLNCCHTRLVCNKGQVRHSGRNLFCPTAFSSQLNKSRFFASLTPVASASSEHLPSVAARSVLGPLCFYLGPFFSLLFQAGRSNVSPSPAPYWRIRPSSCTTRLRLPWTPSPKRWVWHTRALIRNILRVVVVVLI